MLMSLSSNSLIATRDDYHTHNYAGCYSHAIQNLRRGWLSFTTLILIALRTIAQICASSNCRQVADRCPLIHSMRLRDPLPTFTTARPLLGTSIVMTISPCALIEVFNTCTSGIPKGMVRSFVSSFALCHTFLPDFSPFYTPTYSGYHGYSQLTKTY